MKLFVIVLFWIIFERIKKIGRFAYIRMKNSSFDYFVEQLYSATLFGQEFYWIRLKSRLLRML